MKTRLLLILGLAVLASCSTSPDSGPKSIFNGKDLTGWEGMAGFWSVRDGAITGQSTAAMPVEANHFLIWKGGDLANFELRLKFRLTAQNDKSWGNSGVQYRSKILDAAKFVVGGYQADIDSPFKYTGMLYEEKGRGILMVTGEKIKIGATTMADDAKKKGGQKSKTEVEKLPGATPNAEIAAAYKLGEWNEMVITAKGNHLQHFINGKLTADVIDMDDVKGAKSGVLALQIHKGEPMTIQFKDLQLKTLP